MKLQDQVAVVTGGGKGIGKAISLLFAREGATVIINGTDQQALEAVAAARHAFDHGPWPTTPPAERAARLMQMIDLLEPRVPELCAAWVAQVGGLASFAPVMHGNPAGTQAEYVGLEPFRGDIEGQPSVIALPVPRPYSHYGKVTSWAVGDSLPDAVGARAHVGIYVYRRETLLKLASAPAATLELEESLEQLRALANGIRIRVVDTKHLAAGVDTPEDLERVRSMMLASSRT